VFLFNEPVFFNYRQTKATNAVRMQSLLTLTTLHVKEQNSYRLSKEWYFCTTRNSCSSTQKQTKVNSIATTSHIRRTLTCAVVGMKFYYRQSLNSGTNIT